MQAVEEQITPGNGCITNRPGRIGGECLVGCRTGICSMGQRQLYPQPAIYRREPTSDPALAASRPVGDQNGVVGTTIGSRSFFNENQKPHVASEKIASVIRQAALQAQSQRLRHSRYARSHSQGTRGHGIQWIGARWTGHGWRAERQGKGGHRA